MAITVTTISTPPSADLFLDALPAGTTSVRVWRVAEKQERVRGDSLAPVISGEARVRDFDVPIERPFAYRAECFAADGAALGAVALTTTYMITGIDTNQMWLSDPLIPQMAQIVTVLKGSDDERTYDSDTVYGRVIGRQAPNAISGQRSAADGWTFVIKSTTFAQAFEFEDLFAGGGVLLLRPHPDAVAHRTGVIYLSAPSIKRSPRRDFAYQNQRADWVIIGREVNPPGASAVAPDRTWQTVKDGFADWQDVRDNGVSWLDVLRG